MMVGREVLLRVEKKPAEPGETLLEVERPCRRRRPRAAGRPRRLVRRARRRDRRHRGRRRQRAERADRSDHGPARAPRAATIVVAGRVIHHGERPEDARRRSRATSRRTGSAAGSCSSSRSPRTSRCTTTATPPDSRFGWLFPRRLIERARAADPRVRRARRRADHPRRRASPAATSRRWSSRARSRATRGCSIAAQPTRGLDVGAIEYLHRRLVEERDEGRAILLVSLELDEILSLSDRILVMYEGEIVGEHTARRDARKRSASRCSAAGARRLRRLERAARSEAGPAA